MVKDLVALFFVCFVVTLFDLAHDVEAIIYHHCLLLAVNMSHA